jgi:hypothetical protein
VTNPELRRHAWLELDRHRLVVVPAVLAALVVLVLATAEQPALPIAHGALTVFAVATIGWGALRAYASVVDEVRDRTWDFQRMAAVEPQSLALGKVLGAPLLAWYIGGWCLLAYLVAGLVAGVDQIPATLVGAVAIALLVHSLGVAMSALVARTPVAARSRRFSGLLAFLAMIYLLPALIAIGWGGDQPDPRVHWWLLRQLPMRTFIALSAVLFAAWAFFAAWRAMARELREPAWWWGWPAFAAFAAFWFAGLSGPGFPAPRLHDVIGLAAAILCGALYLGLSLDPLTPVGWTRLKRVADEPGVAWHRRLPLWLTHGLLATALALLAFILATAAGPLRGTGPVPAMILAVTLMALRDAAIVTCFTLASRARHPVGRAAFYILLADVLAPLLLNAIGQRELAWAVFPLLAIGESTLVPVLGMAVQAAIAAGALAWLVRRRRVGGG